MLRKVLQKIINYLIKGALVVVPLAGATFVIIWLVATVDGALNLTALFLKMNLENRYTYQA